MFSVLYIGDHDIPDSDEHEGYVAGRYRDGAYSDSWTDVRRCAERTFLAYAPACECGWRGEDQLATDHGHQAARRHWLDQRFGPLTGQSRSWDTGEFLDA